MSCMVGVPGEDGSGAVKLLGQDEAGQFMRQCHGAEGKQQGGALKRRGAPAIGRAHGKDKRLGCGLPVCVEECREPIRGKRASAWVKQNGTWRGAQFYPGKCVKERGFCAVVGRCYREVRYRALNVSIHELCHGTGKRTQTNRTELQFHAWAKWFIA